MMAEYLNLMISSFKKEINFGLEVEKNSVKMFMQLTIS